MISKRYFIFRSVTAIKSYVVKQKVVQTKQKRVNNEKDLKHCFRLNLPKKKKFF